MEKLIHIEPPNPHEHSDTEFQLDSGSECVFLNDICCLKVSSIGNMRVKTLWRKDEGELIKT